MNYQQLRNFALQCSLEHHLCNVEELLEDKTIFDILGMTGDEDKSVIYWEPYEQYDGLSLVDLIEDLRGVYVYNFMQVLQQVNGAEWVTNFKGEA